MAAKSAAPEEISLITMDASGNTGAASTLDSFPFSVGDALYEATYRKGKVTILRRDPEEIPFG